KTNFRCGGRFFCHSSNSAARERTVDIGISYDGSDGYNFSKTLFRILDTENRASALDTRVDSPGKVGRYSVSVTFSSSTSVGYSTRMSSSRSKTGSPVKAAENLQSH